MKKLVLLILMMILILVSCQTDMVAKGIREYNPDEDEPENIHVDFAFYYSDEEFVEMADVIGIITVETLKHVIVEPEDPSISPSKSMYGEFKFNKVLYTDEKGISDDITVNIHIFYQPEFENIPAPGFEVGGEYLVFLQDFTGMPMVYTNFYDYILLFDYSKFKLDATEKNISKISELIDSIK